MDAPAVLPDDAPIPPPVVTSGRPSVWIALPRRIVLTLIAFALALGLLGVLQETLRQMMLADTRLPPPARAALERGDWSQSWAVTTGNPVAEVIQSRAGNTLILVFAAMFAAGVMIAVSAVLATAVHALEERVGPVGSILKALGRLWVFGWGSAPIFWLGIMFLLIFAIQFREWGLPPLPSGGVTSLNDGGSIGDRLLHLILPTLTLALFPAGISGQAVARMVTLNREANRSNFLTGLLAIPTVLLEQVGGFLGAAVLVEVIFAYPGIGHLLFNAMGRFDVPIFLGIVRWLMWMILVGRLLAVILRAVLNVVAGDALPVEPNSYRRRARRIWVIAALALLLIPLVLAVLGAVGGDAVTAADPASRFAPPSAEHPLGTDELGRDVRARLLRGAWVTVSTAGAAALIALPAALLLGGLAGWLRTRRTALSDSLADVVLLPAEVPLFIPALLWMPLLVVFTGGGSVVVKLILLFALALMPRAAQAAAALWGSWPQPVRSERRWGAGIAAVFLASMFVAVQIGAALDFLGFGIQPPTPSLGTMLSRILDYLFVNPALGWWPALALWGIGFSLYTAADALIGYFPTKEVMPRLNQ